MGKQGQIKLNRYQLDETIKKYHDHMCKYIRMKDELDSLTAATSTAKYGIEATMAKALREVRVIKIKCNSFIKLRCPM
ncbi:hypothetical protein [Lysinibacillus sp. ZYM-1]|uniref:hypothetical protein n=1 Tax=Lysinibacillus sp. ZYM-1 TaxID=1681184 RepID=UPI0006CE96BE|nr:hypothetical protein [Lysinibacillus sp. ZYM-1]KPN96293.1 hypothetical protein AO843_17835 [Lysinibacillus sp. ZYM-1]